MCDVLLIEGGHAHIQVIKHFGMNPQPGVRLTLVSEDVLSPYSGMLPGYVAGHYSSDDIHFDLAALCSFAGVRLIVAKADGLDLENQLVRFDNRPSIRYDVLSLNSGAIPMLPSGVDGTTVKPIAHFLPKWHRAKERLTEGEHLVLVGSGGFLGHWRQSARLVQVIGS